MTANNPAPDRAVAATAARWLERGFLPLALAAWGLGFAWHIMQAAVYGHAFVLDWKLPQYAVNYIDFGFARRALAGTILYPLAGLFVQPGPAAYGLVAITDLAAFAIVAVLADRTLRALAPEWHGCATWLRAALLLSPLGFIEWGYDAGRYDHLAIVLIVGAITLVQHNRALAAGAVLTVAVLLHEAAFFYAMPAVLLAALDRMPPDRMARDRTGIPPAGRQLMAPIPRVAAIALPPAACTAALALWGHIDPALVAARLGTTDGGAAVWTRGTFEPARHLDATGLAVAAVALACAALPVSCLRPRWIARTLFLLPLALFALGEDWFRWTHLIWAMAVLSLLMLARAGAMPPPAPGRIGRLLLAITLLPLGPIGIDHALPYARLAAGMAHVR